MSRISRTILRLAAYELLYMPEIPRNVVINEAVELAKRYEDERAPAFVNGILGSFVRAEFQDTPPKPVKETVEE